MSTETHSIRKAGRPARLSRDLILRAALAIADDSGIESVTMLRVARAIRAEPMSLYRHVRNKDDLLDGLVDLVFAEIELPSSTEPWRSAMRRRAISAREVLSRHPWAIGLMESRTHPGAANLAHHEAVLANLFAAGFSPAGATRAYNLVDSFVYGFALQEKSIPVATNEAIEAAAAEMFQESRITEYPHLEAVATALVSAGFRYGDEFEPGLDLILEGLDRQHRAAGNPD